MKLSQIRQALNVRVLRAEKAERALNQARAAEAQAQENLRIVQWQLENFDRSYEERISAFYEKSLAGTSPDSLYSTRTFHADLALERDKIVEQIRHADQILWSAGQTVNEKRKLWSDASQASDNLKDIYKKKISELKRYEERREEIDADELSIARAYRDAG